MPSISSHLNVDRRNTVVGSLISYSRSQTFLSGSNLTSTPPVDFQGRNFLDEEEGHIPDLSEDEEDVEDNFNNEERHTPLAPDDQFVVGNSSWDDEPEFPTPTTLPPSTSPRPVTSPNPHRSRTASRALPASIRRGLSPITTTRSSPASPLIASPLRPSSAPAIAPVSERTPLISVTSHVHRYQPSEQSSPASDGAPTLIPSTPASIAKQASQTSLVDPANRLQRKNSPLPPARSTYGQTLFNSIAILLGIGMLSCPMAFACAGWLGGTLLIIFYGFLTCYTAKVIAKIVVSDGHLRTYADIGQAAFGPKSNMFTSFLFCLEIFAVSVVLVVLFSDSLHEVLPQYSSNTYKVIGLLVIIPTSFFPLRLLSFASILGVFSTIMLIYVLLQDGLTKPTAPGSIWEGAPTTWWPDHWTTSVPISFGLFMAGFAGHAVIPSIVRDMEDPTHYESMINWSFFVATIVYGLIGAAGYQMFGNGVSDEVSQDLLRTPGYNKFLNQFALWMLVLSPITKLPLATRPMNLTIEILLGIEEASPVPKHNQAAHAEPTLSKDDEETPPEHFYLQSQQSDTPNHESRKAVWRSVERTGLSLLVVLVAIYVPDFSTTMAFLGAFSAFTLCVIGPLLAKMALERHVGLLDPVLIVISVIMATWATYLAIVSV